MSRLRVTGGSLRGRRFRSPGAADVRPTSDRVREALFARLGELSGLHVLDLYAGSGALGIEALSRGAERVVFVERSTRPLETLRRNLRELGLEGSSRVLRGDVAAVLARLGRRKVRFDLILLDPPYASREAERALRALAAADALSAGARIVLEASRRASRPEVSGLAFQEERCYGDTRVAWYAPAGASPEERRDCDMGEESPRRKSLALFPASFDPVTHGHLDLVDRALAVFDELVVAVATNVGKEGTFSAEERLEMLNAVLGDRPGVRLTHFDGLLVDYARQIGAHVVIRGLRAVSDFEYEFEMALMNRHLYPEIETLFLMTSQAFFYVSSSRLKELVRFGTSIDTFVPPIVAKKLREKLRPG